MPRFAFKLEGVMRSRKSVEKQRQTELAQALSQLRQLEEQLSELDRQVKATTDDLRQNRLSGTIDLRYLMAYRRYVAAMQRKAMGIANAIGGQHQVVNAARLLLANAAKERRIIEKLREKQYERWRAEQERKEMLQADELNVQMSYQKIVAEDEANVPIISGSEAV